MLLGAFGIKDDGVHIMIEEGKGEFAFARQLNVARDVEMQQATYDKTKQ